MFMVFLAVLFVFGLIILSKKPQKDNRVSQGELRARLIADTNHFLTQYLRRRKPSS